MHLKRLEIHGFKSFAQKTTMEFSKGIIAIVGPNGSGKSNVADSLRWVLGEQSAKMIRGKKSDDVIFAGSEKKVRMGFAEVVATFDNSDRRIPVDSAEVSIGRRIDRSGESEYLINGNKVRLLDIVDLVLKSNIGTSRYTVIGQGTIDQMILAGPSEVKSLVDEASGVKTYYIRREKTLRRLEQTANNLMRAEDLMAEIEPRLKSLRRQAKKMEARAEIEQELKIYQREFFGRAYYGIKVNLDTLNAQLGSLQQKRTALESSVQGHRKALESFEGQTLENNAEQNKIREQLDRLQKQKNKLLEDLSLVRGKMQSHKTFSAGDSKTLQVDLHSVNSQIHELTGKIQQTRQEFEKNQYGIKDQNNALQKVGAILDELYKKIQNPQSVDWESFGRELDFLEGAFSQFISSIENSGDLAFVKQQSFGFKNAFDKFKKTAKNNVLNPQTHFAELQKQLQHAQRQKDQLGGVLKDLELALTKNKLSLDFLEKELSTKEQEKLQLELELKKAQSGSDEDFLKELVQEESRILTEAKDLGGKISEVEEAFKNFLNEQSAKNKALHEREGELRRQQDEVSKIKDHESQISIEKAKFDTQMEVLKEEILRILGVEILQNIDQVPPQGEAPAGLEEKILRLKNQLDMIGGMDELTLKEYQETESRYTNLNNQVEDLKRSMQDLKSVMDELDGHIKAKFSEAFYKINEKFEHYFRILFNGGRAYLSLVKSDDVQSGGTEAVADGSEQSVDDSNNVLRPEEKIVQKYEHGASNIIGIDIKATPPNKKLSSIQALSGGERSLTSIALLCSMLTCFPSPFVVLDEVDAALDDANTIRFAQILSSLSGSDTQFVTITHNRETMAHANILYGVTMGEDGISKLLSVKLEQAKAYAK